MPSSHRDTSIEDLNNSLIIPSVLGSIRPDLERAFVAGGTRTVVQHTCFVGLFCGKSIMTH